MKKSPIGIKQIMPALSLDTDCYFSLMIKVILDFQPFISCFYVVINEPFHHTSAHGN